MNKTSKSRRKTQYFRKDYAPAIAMANRRKSTSRTRQTATKLTQTAQKVAHKTTKNFNKIVTKVHTSAAKSKATRASNKSHRIPFTWREKTLISLLSVSATAIIITLIFSFIYNPVRRGEHELEKLAKAYYVEYLYPRSLGKNLDQPEQILADFTEQGLPNVRLRQLLLYNDGKHADSLSILSNDYYQCDTNRSYVRYYPVAPYGPRDFTVFYGTECETN